MSDTIVSSATKEVVIGAGRPFVIIGEKINPTGRPRLAAEMKAGDFSTVVADARAQVEAGARMLDVNAGIPLADEPAILAETVRLVQSLTDVPLTIDSSIVAALEAGLAAYQGKPLVKHFLGSAHTLANFETAFYRSSVADNNSFEQWESEGAKDATTRATGIWKKMLADYEPPPIDEAVDQELREWIERQKASFPDSNV